jgi:hypothetical protein
MPVNNTSDDSNETLSYHLADHPLERTKHPKMKTAMKIKITKKLLILISTVAVLAGCETSHRAASVSPEFPPAPATHENSP